MKSACCDMAKVTGWTGVGSQPDSCGIGCKALGIFAHVADWMTFDGVTNWSWRFGASVHGQVFNDPVNSKDKRHDRLGT